MTPLAVTAYTATSALGRGIAPRLTARRSRSGGVKAHDFDRATGARAMAILIRLRSLTVSA